MSFWPFPTILRAELAGAANAGPVVDVGAGGGGLTARLRSCGVPALALDLDPLCRGLDFVADLRSLPFGTRRVGGLVFGDVHRHLVPRDREAAAESCERALADGGRVVILEDHPTGRNEAERNYREVLSLLADFVPGRGAARPIERLTRELRQRFGPAICAGDAENETVVEDPGAPLRWLASHVSVDRAQHARLESIATSIETHGMRYGRYCFEVYAREGVA